ncbi:hypothetical protein K439DRAFT_696251 [Ramaria rubella]|nr:hypothetical protein K439DRAFT_696251 [Ramaria rubella]
MTTNNMDYLFEDTTGDPTMADFHDVQDRRFLRVRKTLIRINYTAIQVYDFGSVKPLLYPSEYHHLSRAVLTIHHSGGSIGTIKYEDWTSPIPVEEYLRKSLLSRSNNRTFTMSNGQEYRWTDNPSLGHAWTCHNSQRYLVAHYDQLESTDTQRPQNYWLSIDQTFIHLTVEILTSLILMRNIAERN